jgi:hypothetical protein
VHKRKPIPITHLPKRERPLCGARSRRGTECQRRALDNGRCRNHGGLSTGPKTAAGRQRISEGQRRRWADWRSCPTSTNFAPSTRKRVCAHHGLLLDWLKDFVK